MKHWQIIDLVRTFCVLAVLGVHYYSNIPFAHPWVCWLWGRFCFNGIYGVFLFFAVSGFLITHVIANGRGGLFKPDFRAFYVQRAGRIVPLFLFCFSIGVFIFLFTSTKTTIYPYFFPAGGDYGPMFWTSISTFTFNWFLVFKPNWSYSVYWMILWSLSIEEQFYLTYPLALKKAARLKHFLTFLLLVIAFAVAWRVYFYVHGRENDFVQSYASPAKFDLIAFGILLYLAHIRYGPFLSRHKMASSILCAVGFCLTLLVYFGSRESERLSQVWVPEGLGLGIFGFMLGGLHLPLFESRYLKPFCLPGKYCYGCYLLHPLAVFFVRPFLIQWNVFLGFFLFAVATTLMAAVSYHCFEEPTKHFLRNFFAGHTVNKRVYPAPREGA